MPNGRVLVVVTPHVYATAVAASLSQQHRFDVVVTDVGRGETTAAGGFDAIVTNVIDVADAPRRARAVIEIPEPPIAEFIVTADDLRVAVPIGDRSLLETIAMLIERFAPAEDAAPGIT